MVLLTAENAAAGVVLVSLCAYTIFGGADFGGGVWTLLASGPRAGEQREALFRAMGPVWETNHIWLILVVVALFTTFPTAFAGLFVALLTPLVVALLGIVLRGAAFAFRHYGEEGVARLPATTEVFAAASIVTPLALGVCAGAIASGHIHLGADGTGLSGEGAWHDPFALLCAAVALALCALLTAAFMTVRTAGALREDFRRRALAAALVVGALTTAGLLWGHADGSFFARRLASPMPALLVGGAALCGLVTLAVLWTRRWWLAPAAAAATAGAVLLAWGAAQYPYIVPPDLTIVQAAGPHETIVAFLIAMPVGAAVVLPSLWLLYRVLASSRTDRPDREGETGARP